MPRILQVYKTYCTEQVAGVCEVMHQVAHGCMAHGIETRIFTLSHTPTPPIIMDEGVEVHRYPVDFTIASTEFSAAAMLAFAREAEWADIIHYHAPWPYGDLMHLLRRPKKPVVVTYHSDIVRQKNLLRVYGPLMHWFLAAADAIVATSPNYIATSEVLARYRDKTVAIPIGITDATRTPPSTSALKAMQARVGHQRFFSFVGVLRYYKGLHYLLEANAGVDLPVVIAGSGPKEAELKAQAASLGLRNTVFLGQVTDEEKAALLYLSHGFLFPSHLRSEAFGISLLEAAMFGKPMISADIGTGSSYINQNTITGITVPPENPLELRAAMQKLWNDHVLAKTMGTAARTRYETLFTADTMADGYARLYQRLLAR